MDYKETKESVEITANDIGDLSDVTGNNEALPLAATGKNVTLVDEDGNELSPKTKASQVVTDGDHTVQVVIQDINSFKESKGKAGGLASLDSSGKVPASQLPSQEGFDLQIAGDNVLGGIKTGYKASGKNYAVDVDSNGKAFVNVPWEDTTYDVFRSSGDEEVSEEDGLVPGPTDSDYNRQVLFGDAKWRHLVYKEELSSTLPSQDHDSIYSYLGNMDITELRYIFNSGICLQTKYTGGKNINATTILHPSGKRISSSLYQYAFSFYGTTRFDRLSKMELYIELEEETGHYKKLEYKMFPIEPEIKDIGWVDIMTLDESNASFDAYTTEGMYRFLTRNYYGCNMLVVAKDESGNTIQSLMMMETGTEGGYSVMNKMVYAVRSYNGSSWGTWTKAKSISY